MNFFRAFIYGLAVTCLTTISCTAIAQDTSNIPFMNPFRGNLGKSGYSGFKCKGDSMLGKVLDFAQH
jgi:hypothetical protein